MRRLVLSLALIASVALTANACKRPKRDSPAVEDEPAGMLTMVHAADSRAASQLVRGFHAVEENAWRWTEGSFAATLKPPMGAAQKGATLQLKFVVPEVVVSKLGSLTLSAKVNGQPLDPETYTQAGEYTYSRDVPASALQNDPVAAEFALDKSLPPSGQDSRNLGVIMTIVGFEAKP